jgi:hypothetical protein
MVVRGAPRDDPHASPAPGQGPVVLGVDGSSRSSAAVEFAIHEAASRDQPLIAVHTWEAPKQSGEGADRVPEEATAGAAARYPNVRLEHRVVESANPAKGLLRVAEDVRAALMSVLEDVTGSVGCCWARRARRCLATRAARWRWCTRTQGPEAADDRAPSDARSSILAAG